VGDGKLPIVTVPGFYPEGHKLTDEYAKAYEPSLMMQLYAAGQRLAAILNSVLAPNGGSPR
jgi:hypothetical protein